MKVTDLPKKTQLVPTALELPVTLLGEFNYVDCGAHGDHTNPLLSLFSDARYIGFDPQQTTPLEKDNTSVFFPVAIGQHTGTTKFYRTNNLNCSSLFMPNEGSLRYFMQLGEFLKVEETVQLDTVSLDEYLPQNGVAEIDFMELDTQGSELGILKGAQDFLSSSVLGVRVEVEFFPIYSNQPLFSDVDEYLRQFGFMLFDLERYHLRRKSSPSGMNVREQILWGQALYFRDFLSFPVDLDGTKQRLCKQAVVASYYGFHGYVLDIVNYLMMDVNLLTAEEKQELQNSLTRYVSTLENNRVANWMQFLDRSMFHKAFRRWGNALTGWYEAYQFITSRQKYFWRD